MNDVAEAVKLFNEDIEKIDWKENKYIYKYLKVCIKEHFEKFMDDKNDR